MVPHPTSRLPLTFCKNSDHGFTNHDIPCLILLKPDSFLVDVLPAVLAYYVTAVLVILPGTLAFRRVLLPISLWLLFRAATVIDVGAACGGPEYDFLGYGFCVSCGISCLQQQH